MNRNDILASSHFNLSNNTFVALFFLRSHQHPRLLSELPDSIRVRVSQWCGLAVSLELREEDESGQDVVRRALELQGPSQVLLTAHLCHFVALVSASTGVMPRLRVMTVSTLPSEHLPQMTHACSPFLSFDVASCWCCWRDCALTFAVTPSRHGRCIRGVLPRCCVIWRA